MQENQYSVVPSSDLCVACNSCAVNHKVDFEKGSQSCKRILKGVYSLHFGDWVLESEVAAVFLLCELLHQQSLSKGLTQFEGVLQDMAELLFALLMSRKEVEGRC